MPVTQKTIDELLPKSGKHSLGESFFLIVREPGRGYYVGQFRQGMAYKSRSFGAAPDASYKQALGKWRAFKVALDSGTAPPPRLRRSIHHGMPRPDSGSPVGAIFGEAVHDYVERKAVDWMGGRIGRTARDYAALARVPILARLTAEQLTDETIRVYTAAMAPRLRRETRRMIETVRAFMLTGEVQMKAAKVKHLAALPWQQLPEFFDKLSASPLPQARCLAFLIMTGARVSELVGHLYGKQRATWKEIDGDVWRVPPERMKAGDAHEVPLTPQMLELLGPRKADNEPLFAIGSQVGMYLLTQRLNDAITVHGFRATFKTWCSENRVDRELAELCLAHKIGSKVEQAYDRTTLLADRRKVMEQWSAFCESAATSI